MRIKELSILLLTVVSLSSCWKGEDPFELPPAGGAVTQELQLGENYDKIVYFNVHTQKFLIRNLADWDLAFECGDSGLRIRTNGGKSIKVHQTSITNNFTQPYTLGSSFVWDVDASSGHPDSTAVGKWWAGDKSSENRLMIMDMGDAKTYRRFQVLSADATGYNVRVGEQDNKDLTKTGYADYFIPKDNKRNQSYFNIATGQAITDMEPEKDEWDVVFTRYTHVFHDMTPAVPYLVTGVLLNPNGVLAYEEQNKPFEDIDINYAAGLTFTPEKDVIGYDWKSYSQTSGRYVVDKTRTYIIKTVSGYYYKFRFIDFYNQQGVKGTPVFELQRL